MSDEWIIGVDVSHHQRTPDGAPMNWRKCAAAGARFAYVRAGLTYYGDNRTDREFEYNAGEAPKYLPTGAYWFFRPTKPIEQAHYVYNLIKDKNFALPLMVDCERSDGFDQYECQEALLTFFIEFEELAGYVPEVIYTRGEFWNTNYGDPPWLLEEHNPLAIARYGDPTRDDDLDHPWEDDSRTKPRIWDDWLLWQYSADGNMLGDWFGASSNSIDLNRFNGGEAEFQAWIAGEEPDDPDIPLNPLIPQLPEVIVLVNGLRLRRQPKIAWNIIGNHRGYDILQVAGIHESGNDIWLAVLGLDNAIGWSAMEYRGTRYLEWVE